MYVTALFNLLPANISGKCYTHYHYDGKPINTLVKIDLQFQLHIIYISVRCEYASHMCTGVRRVASNGCNYERMVRTKPGFLFPYYIPYTQNSAFSTISYKMLQLWFTCGGNMWTDFNVCNGLSYNYVIIRLAAAVSTVQHIKPASRQSIFYRVFVI